MQNLLSISDILLEKYENLCLKWQKSSAKSAKSDSILNVNFKKFSIPSVNKITLPFILPENDCQYFIKSLNLVQEFGWKLLAFYEFDKISGNFSYKGPVIFENEVTSTSPSINQITKPPTTAMSRVSVDLDFMSEGLATVASRSPENIQNQHDTEDQPKTYPTSTVQSLKARTNTPHNGRSKPKPKLPISKPNFEKDISILEKNLSTVENFLKNLCRNALPRKDFRSRKALAAGNESEEMPEFLKWFLLPEEAVKLLEHDDSQPDLTQPVKLNRAPFLPKFTNTEKTISEPKLKFLKELSERYVDDGLTRSAEYFDLFKEKATHRDSYGSYQREDSYNWIDLEKLQGRGDLKSKNKSGQSQNQKSNKNASTCCVL